MVQEDRASPSGKQRLVRWALFLGALVVLAWLIAYVLGIQIYDAAVQVTH
ncbi:MAG TPA: hypothetical protein VHC71_02895 [Hyphomicrobium sp.]|jgi:hypothetical protein|nr:hypothetical protein [Hyphomicrobium sp.]